MPGSASTTAGMACTACMAVASRPLFSQCGTSMVMFGLPSRRVSQPLPGQCGRHLRRGLVDGLLHDERLAPDEALPHPALTGDRARLQHAGRDLEPLVGQLDLLGGLDPVELHAEAVGHHPHALGEQPAEPGPVARPMGLVVGRGLPEAHHPEDDLGRRVAGELRRLPHQDAVDARAEARQRERHQLGHEPRVHAGAVDRRLPRPRRPPPAGPRPPRRRPWGRRSRPSSPRSCPTRGGGRCPWCPGRGRRRSASTATACGPRSRRRGRGSRRGRRWPAPRPAPGRRSPRRRGRPWPAT